CLFFFYLSAHHRYLHSFPTRRSSDLLYRCSRKAISRGHRLDCISSGITDNPGRRYSYMKTFTTALMAGKGRRLTSVSPKPESPLDRKSTRLNSSHVEISYAVFCLKKK